MNWWNNLPSSIKDLVRLVVVLLLQQITAAIQSPPAVTVQPSPVVVQTLPGINVTEATAK